MKDVVRVPPHMFDMPIEDAIKKILELQYERKLDKNLGVIILIVDVLEVGEGTMVIGDGAGYFESKFVVLTYKPENNEIVETEVVETVNFGVFVRLGPLDGLIHFSQITKDYMSYDQKKHILVGNETKRMIAVGDIVRARIVAVSMNSMRIRDSKIGLTMRQPGLGKLEWIEEEREKEG